MTKKEFMGFSSAAQHDMVLEALVRVTKNLEIIEKASGKPFAGTTKQNANDIKLFTILAEAFGKNELVWNHHDEILSRGDALYTGIEQKADAEESKDNTWKLSPESVRRGNTKPVVEVVDARKRTTLEEYVKEIIKESRGKYYGKEEK